MKQHLHLLTNRLQVSWTAPDLFATRFTVVKLRFPSDNRWDTFIQLLTDCQAFATVEACLFCKENDGQWNYLLLPDKAVDPVRTYVEGLGDRCQTVWYDQPDAIGEHLLLRLLMNSLNQIENTTSVYNLFGTPMLFHPRNFGLRGIHPDQTLIGICLYLSPALCLVAQTKTFSRVWYNPKQEERLYELDAATYRLNRYLPNQPFDPERRLYTPKSRRSDRHNVVAQLRLSPNKAINCKARVAHLFLEALNQRYQEYLTLRFTQIQEVTCEDAPYADNLLAVSRTALQGVTLALEDRVLSPDSIALSAAFEQLIAKHQYHYKAAYNADPNNHYLRWTNDPKEAQLLIQLVPPTEQDTDNRCYLSAYQAIEQTWPNQQIQHVQVKKLLPWNEEEAVVETTDPVTGETVKRQKQKPAPQSDEIDPEVVLPRLVTELTIKHIIAGRHLLSPELSKMFEGWQFGLAQYYTEERHVIGGYLDIPHDGFLSFYAFGDLLAEHTQTLSKLHGLRIAYTNREIEELFEMRETGGTGPFYLMELPNRKRFILTEGAEHVLPNLAEIDRRISQRKAKPTYAYVQQLLREAGLTDIPDFQQLYNIGEHCTQAQIQRIGQYITKQLHQPRVTKQLYERVHNGNYNYLKRVDSLRTGLSGLTDIHWWVEEGQLKYLSGINHHLPKLTSSWHLNGMPHVRTLHCVGHPDYFDTPEGQALIPTLLATLKRGFGRYDAATIKPMPFKLLEEWLDLIALSTLQTHWTALNTARVNDTPNEEAIEEQTF